MPGRCRDHRSQPRQLRERAVQVRIFLKTSEPNYQRTRRYENYNGEHLYRAVNIRTSHSRRWLPIFQTCRRRARCRGAAAASRQRKGPQGPFLLARLAGVPPSVPRCTVGRGGPGILRSTCARPTVFQPSSSWSWRSACPPPASGGGRARSRGGRRLRRAGGGTRCGRSQPPAVAALPPMQSVAAAAVAATVAASASGSAATTPIRPPRRDSPRPTGWSCTSRSAASSC